MEDSDKGKGKTSLTPREEHYASFFLKEILEELRYSKRKEDAWTLAFVSFLILLATWSLFHIGQGPALPVRVVTVVLLIALFWRINDFLSQNRNRQNQVKKVLNATEATYGFPDDRAYVRFTDIKNLDGPGEWDKSDYSLADWDRSEYSILLKVLVAVAALSVLAAVGK